MGLDMYLTRKHHIANYEHDKKGQKLAAAICKAMGFTDTKLYEQGSFNLEVPVAYWRKANAIHGWFVKNVQNNKDDCGEYYVPKEKLIELRDLCKAILNGKEDKGKMPPQEGFFFGNTTDEEYYRDDLNDTIEQIDAVLSSPDNNKYATFQYSSSW